MYIAMTIPISLIFTPRKTITFRDLLYPFTVEYNKGIIAVSHMYCELYAPVIRILLLFASNAVYIYISLSLSLSHSLTHSLTLSTLTVILTRVH